MIESENIIKSFGENKVLKGISTRFEKGKTNLIIGKSGAGKTVFLKCLVGLMTPSEGKVLYDGVSLHGLKRDERREISKQIGMLFQGSALFDSLSVMENVRFPLDMFSNMTHKEKQMRAEEVLERVELHEGHDRYPSEISGGMQKRVGIARAIVLNPRYLFCDEPNSGLDPKTAIVIDDLISNITKDNQITTIINTHDMNSVMEIGENIVLLHQGKLGWTGNKDEVLSSENEILTDFIFASPFLQKLRNKFLNSH